MNPLHRLGTLMREYVAVYEAFSINDLQFSVDASLP